MNKPAWAKSWWHGVGVDIQKEALGKGKTLTPRRIPAGAKSEILLKTPGTSVQLRNWVKKFGGGGGGGVCLVLWCVWWLVLNLVRRGVFNRFAQKKRGKENNRPIQNSGTARLERKGEGTT